MAIDSKQVAQQWARLADVCDYMLILPSNDERINALFNSLFTEKLSGCQGIIVENLQAEQIINLYSLYAFTDKLIIGSFDLPPGRKLRNLLESGIATEEELINDVILGVMDGSGT